jgi:hypothetical protein
VSIADFELEVVDERPGASSGFATVREPPGVGAGPCLSQRQAKRQAAIMNERLGGPGFFVEDRNGNVVEMPHGYFAERSTSGEWYVVLKEMPAGPVLAL